MEIKLKLREHIDKLLIEQEVSIDFMARLNEILDEFKQLEEEYNKYNLDELKRDYKLDFILEKAETLNNKFEALNKLFYDDDYVDEESESYEEIDNAMFRLSKPIDSIMEDLKKMKELFTEMGDLDKGSFYFRRLFI